MKDKIEANKKFFELTSANRTEEWKKGYLEIIKKWEEISENFEVVEYDYDRYSRNSYGGCYLEHKVIIKVLKNVPSLQDVSIAIGYDIAGYRLLCRSWKGPRNIRGNFYLYEFTISDYCD
jgi:hypothetical protein